MTLAMSSCSFLIFIKLVKGKTGSAGLSLSQEHMYQLIIDKGDESSFLTVEIRNVLGAHGHKLVLNAHFLR